MTINPKNLPVPVAQAPIGQLFLRRHARGASLCFAVELGNDAMTVVLQCLAGDDLKHVQNVPYFENAGVGDHTLITGALEARPHRALSVATDETPVPRRSLAVGSDGKAYIRVPQFGQPAQHFDIATGKEGTPAKPVAYYPDWRLVRVDGPTVENIALFQAPADPE